MEFDKRKYKPDFNIRSVLYQQVEEQSQYCDVTIQVGNWRKAFHWCVLVACPFFESIWRNNFMEKQTGIIELHVATPSAVENALMYLYGRMPLFTEDNISAMLEISDFFMITSLNNSCVQYIQNTCTTTKNCIKMLELSCVYEFELTGSCDYIRSHLDEVLRNPEATHLTRESITELFTDPLLSYVTAEERFTFLVKWAKESQRNEVAFPDMLKAIYLGGMDKSFLERVVLENSLVQHKCDTSLLQAKCSAGDHMVLVFSEPFRQTKLACFDLDEERWCGIETEMPGNFEQFNRFCRKVIVGVRGSKSPEIYTNEEMQPYSNSPPIRVHSHNLQTKQTSVIEINVEGARENFCSYIRDETVIVILNEKIRRNDETQKCDLTDQYVYSKILKNVHKRAMLSSTIFYGHLQSPVTDTHPIVTVKDTELSSCCLNSGNIIAALSNSDKTIYIYDIAGCKITALQISEYFGRYPVLKLSPTDEGFIIHTNERAVVISGSNERPISNECVIKVVNLDSISRFFYCDEIWFRFLNPSLKSEVEFASLSHEHITEGDSNDLPWRKLPLPKELTFVRLSNHAFIMRLPRSLLNCHCNCPHCPDTGEKETVYYDDNFFYTDFDSDFDDTESYYNDNDGYNYYDTHYWDASADEFVSL